MDGTRHVECVNIRRASIGSGFCDDIGDKRTFHTFASCWICTLSFKTTSLYVRGEVLNTSMSKSADSWHFNIRVHCIEDSGPLLDAQYAVEGRNYVNFEFAANSGNYIRRAIAVVTVANGAGSIMRLLHSKAWCTV